MMPKTVEKYGIKDDFYIDNIRKDVMESGSVVKVKRKFERNDKNENMSRFARRMSRQNKKTKKR